MSFRKEKKYRLTYSDQFLYKEKLLAAGMEQLYPPRRINSIYFDNRLLEMFVSSDEGVLPRKKIRVRAYDSSLQFSKEVKISSLEGRFKLSEKLPESTTKNIHDLTFFDPDYGVLEPVLKVAYQREYFSYLRMRITFDSYITYSCPRNISRLGYNDEESVMEVKVSSRMPDDFIEALIDMPTSRFSKYSRGMQALGY